MEQDFPNKAVRIAIVSSSAHLPVVRSALGRMCEMMGFDEEVCGGIVLSLDEALTNIIRHAYHGAEDRPIEITFRPALAADSIALAIEVRDWGDFVEPERIRSRDLGELRPGGLGVHIMNSCMDEVKFTRAADGGTVLTMVKKVQRRKDVE